MANRYDRRTFLGNSARTAAGLAVAGSAGSLLASCSSSSTSSTNSVTKNYKARGGANPISQAVRGGNLVFGTEAEESGFDPTYAHFDSTGVMYARTVYDPLAMALADGTIVPYLAQSITPNTDYTEWTVTLRPNVFFHDGTPCNSTALAFCFNECKASQLVNFTVTYMEKAVKTGPLSVKVIMNAPWVSFPAWLAGYIGGQIAYPFSPTQYMKTGVGGLSLINSHPVGTGPFVFSVWEAGDHFTATANPNYWRKDALGKALPYLDSITYKPLPVVAERWSGLKSGTLDIIHTDDPQTIIDIRADNSLWDVEDVDSPVEHDMDFGMINTTLAPFDDIRMRQAFAYGFNQPDYLAIVGLGILNASTGPFQPGSQYYSPTGYPSYDQAKAMALINSYKADHGNQPLSIIFGTTDTPTSQQSAGVIEQFVQPLGISMSVEPIQQSALINDAIFGQYHVLGWRQFANVDPDLNYPFWASTVPNGGISVNFTRLKDNTVQTLIDKARQSTDQEERVEAYQNVAKQFGEQCAYIWVDEDIWAIGAQSSVLNFNNPTTPDGKAGLQMLSGILWPTETWKTA